MFLMENRMEFRPSILRLIVYAVMALCAATVSAQEHNDPRWITTWATSPSTLPPENNDYQSVNNQTLRLIIHTSVGGEAFRLRLSNYHGDQAINIGAVSVALQESNSTISSNSALSVTFNGQESINLPRGAVVFSDAITADVPELLNLSVSIYLPDETGFLTAHALSNQTNYVSEPGNYTKSITFPMQSQTPCLLYTSPSPRDRG